MDGAPDGCSQECSKKYYQDLPYDCYDKFKDHYIWRAMVSAYIFVLKLFQMVFNLVDHIVLKRLCFVD